MGGMSEHSHQMVAGVLSYRELSRAPAAVMDAVERDGSSFAISRYGRMVALLVPLSERVTVEFDEAASPPRARPKSEPHVDLEALSLTTLARQFLIDTAATPTGFWWVPDEVILAEGLTVLRTLDDLDSKRLIDRTGAKVCKITKLGRTAARALVGAGHKGYHESHPDGYHPG